jgi:hypothetical protein
MDYMIERAILVACPFVDTFMTWYLVRRTQKPGMELNSLAKLLWNRLGLGAGTVVMGAISVGIMAFFAVYVDSYAIYALLGMYATILYIHYHVFWIVREEKKDEKEEEKEFEVMKAEYAGIIDRLQRRHLEDRGLIDKLEKNIHRRGIMTEEIERWKKKSSC